MSSRLGFFVPEFPGQTHIWIWRDMHFLEQFGVELFLISTRRPPPLLVTHTWSPEVMRRTHYLYPIPIRAMFASLWEVLRRPPRLVSMSEGNRHRTGPFCQQAPSALRPLLDRGLGGEDGAKK